MLERDIIKTDYGKERYERFFGRFFPQKKVTEHLKQDTPKKEVVDEPSENKDLFNEPEIKKKQKTNEKTLEQTLNQPFSAPIEEKKPLYIEELTPYTITEYLACNQVVGEEANACLLTVAIANGIHTILEGDSGTGKSYVMNNILKIFDGVYELGLASGQAIWYNTDQINDSKIIYMPELQKAVADKSGKVSGIIEFIKNLGEGKDATKITTNKKRDGVDIYKITQGKTMVSTLANENKFKYDRELQRRFLILETDNSKEHIEAIINDKVERKLNIDVSNKQQNIEKKLIERINYLNEADDVYVLNPFLNYLQDAFPIINKTQSYLEHYINVFEAWGKFFSPERKKIEVDRKKFVFLNLEDVYNVFSMYNSQFLRTIRSFNENEEIPEFRPDWAQCFRDGKKVAQEKLTIMHEGGTINVGKEYPGLIKQWVNEQISGTSVYTVDYKSGDLIKIADLNLQKEYLQLPYFKKRIIDPRRLLT